MPRSLQPPTYRLHKARGCAVVTIDGRNHYLGPFGSPESYQLYARLIAESRASGSAPAPGLQPQKSLNELILAYYQFAQTYYRKQGRPTAELACIQLALRRIRRLYGPLAIEAFGPLKLIAVQESMVAEGLRRRTINSYIHRVKRMFRWGVARELVPPDLYQKLSAVAGLAKGRTQAKEGRSIRPVDSKAIEATLAHLTPVLADMVRVQELTGCRPAEICLLRPVDIDRSGEVWVYHPESHKTQHHDRERVICIGPQAQAILAPYLLRAADTPCFSPRESERQRHDTMRATRQSKVQPSQRDRSKAEFKDRLGHRYTPSSYRRAIQRACDLADRRLKSELLEADPTALAQLKATCGRIVPRWSPNQLRHNAATRIRAAFGIEAAKVILGHSDISTAQIYAEVDERRAREIMQRIG